MRKQVKATHSARAMQLKSFLTALILLLSLTSLSQVTLPFEQHLRIENDRIILRSQSQRHSIYPTIINADSVAPDYPDLLKTNHPEKERSFKNWLEGKLFYESFLKVDKKDFKLRIDPLVCFEAGTENHRLDDLKSRSEEQSNKKTWTNTRGIRVDGVIGKQFAFHTAFYESQAVFPTWLSRKTNELHVVPGQAMYKVFKEDGFDYAFAEGHISYSPSKYFNFRFGHGKNFIGEGYRSLLLSDVAFNYPYLAVTTKVWHLEYLNLYSQHQDIQEPAGNWHPWAKKYSTTHYLSWNILDWLNVGVFESIVWQASDSTGQRGFEINYLNPVIFYRPVEFSLGSPDNALLGCALSVTFLKKNIIYGQLMLDEFKLEHVMKGDGWWANKHGLQIGIKSFDPFNIPLFYLQAEYNHVRPYTYAHNTHLQNYAHYNQPLAHPQGANFREAVIIANKRISRWQFDYKFVYAQYGADTAGLNFGHDLYISYYGYVYEFGNKIGQGLKTTIIQNDISAGWIVNPATNLILSASLTLRREQSVLSKENTAFFTVGLRSALFNRYNDF